MEKHSKLISTLHTVYMIAGGIALLYLGYKYFTGQKV